ncbi:transmembrane protein 119-like [Anguilla anguilla]|uniref:transmembrane protein 119-like n=1 Tax=Anguilla anguilla TaxID=7936 RepID=UPI0015AF5B9A|nr:transmembrane protein 119-like [Anguilla anguilla]
MMFSWVVCLAWASVLSLQVCWCEATPLPVYIATESSGDQDLDTSVATPSTAPIYVHMTPLHTTHGVLTHIPAHPSDSTGVEHFLLGQVRGFLRENLVMVLLVSSLLTAGVFLVCCASAVRRQRKFAAYYPSSFPATCYVDQRDKAGGEPAFRHVPNRPPDAPAAEPRDAAHQLQQDILSAARKLRQTPTKNPARGQGGKSDKHSPPEVRRRQLDTPQTEETSTEKGQEVTPTEKGQEVTPTEKGQEVTPTEKEQEVTPTEKGQEVTPTEKGQEVTPTEKGQEVTPTEKGQEVTPTEMGQEVTPTEKGQEVTPPETEQEVTPAETEQEVIPAETGQEMAPTEMEQELTPTETSQEVKETVLEADLSQSAVSEWGSGTNKDPGAQQEIGSSTAETQEVAASSVKLISGETTAF